MGLGFWEIVTIGIVALLFFGPSRLPHLGKSVGEAIRGFKKGLEGIDDPTTTQARSEKTSEQIPPNTAPGNDPTRATTTASTPASTAQVPTDSSGPDHT